MQKIKVGIMGGTFDPIHNGHLIIAENVRNEFSLDKILFIPSARPPHKENTLISPAIDRYNMVNLSIASNDHFFSSMIEIDREGQTFTIDTLKQLKKQNKNYELYFIIGQDAMKQIHTWKDYNILFDYANFIVVSRMSYDPKEIKIANSKFLSRIQFANTPIIEISSTIIRQKVSQKESITYMVDDLVEKYIYKENLYVQKNSL